ncbi:MAG: hypothetical protein CBC12_05905 [Candidatus Puniceispirillum sp. TMED52]|nr:MAG: hypothetical protein CBC12_05905 [Candidatus Puniceispirillum sp. TMED52]|tara:strand:- start:52 stop:372 length:321 start_codon:yes stop_codon:yes gene_type:complete
MSRYAKVENGIVTTVISANEDYFTNLVETVPGRWIETFKDGSSRKNYAGIGYSYDVDRDAFIPPKLHASWTLNETTCQWEPPVSYPDDYDTVLYSWNEETQTWDAE